MPLSKCRFCGHKVPNPYRPYHESVCRVRRLREGDLYDLSMLPFCRGKAIKYLIEKTEPEDPAQRQLIQFILTNL